MLGSLCFLSSASACALGAPLSAGRPLCPLTSHRPSRLPPSALCRSSSPPPSNPSECPPPLAPLAAERTSSDPRPRASKRAPDIARSPPSPLGPPRFFPGTPNCQQRSSLSRPCYRVRTPHSVCPALAEGTAPRARTPTILPQALSSSRPFSQNDPPPLPRLLTPPRDRLWFPLLRIRRKSPLSSPRRVRRPTGVPRRYPLRRLPPARLPPAPRPCTRALPLCLFAGLFSLL